MAGFIPTLGYFADTSAGQLKVSTKNNTRMDRELKERLHGAIEESPGSWLLQGMSLRAAAARLDWLIAPVRDEENAVSFVGEYRMLLGMSFENLLKGHITMTRVETGQKPVLPKECVFKHSLAALASRAECAALSLSAEDISLLNELSPYIEWAGRYPLPKKAEDVICVAHGSREHRAELELWERLAETLVNKAWIMKGGPAQLGGKRLYVKRREKPDV